MSRLNLRGDRKYWLSPDSVHSMKYDAYYWKDTGEWIEPKCKDKNCEYCADRPDSALGEQK